MKENGVQSVMTTLAGKKLRSSVKVWDMGECLYMCNYQLLALTHLIPSPCLIQGIFHDCKGRHSPFKL